MSADNSLTRILLRFSTLIAALRDGPLGRRALLAQLGAAYPSGDSARRMLDRDIEHLRELGIVIERDSRKRPPTYTLRGGVPAFSEDDLHALALVRETFGDRHPQTSQVRALLDRLTAQLTDGQRRRYQRRPALRAPVEPAIDYAPYDALIADLNTAITAGQRLSFSYRAPRQSRPTRHERVEPHELEFYDRHFYLVAYTPTYHQVFDFRIDRIQHDATFQKLDRLPPGLGHSRAPVAFRYRLAAEVARGGVSQRFAEQRVVETLPNGDVMVEAQGRSDFFIIQTLLRYRANAELLEPAWLREKMQDEVRRLAELYRE